MKECKHCNKNYDDEQEFCSKCGKALAVVPEEKKKPNNKLLAIILSIALLVSITFNVVLTVSYNQTVGLEDKYSAL